MVSDQQLSTTYYCKETVQLHTSFIPLFHLYYFPCDYYIIKLSYTIKSPSRTLYNTFIPNGAYPANHNSKC